MLFDWKPSVKDVFSDKPLWLAPCVLALKHPGASGWKTLVGSYCWALVISWLLYIISFHFHMIPVIGNDEINADFYLTELMMLFCYWNV